MVYMIKYIVVSVDVNKFLMVMYIPNLKKKRFNEILLIVDL